MTAARTRYAEATSVPSERSRAEIERVLKRYGADAFGYIEDRGRVAIMFRARDRHIRFVLPLPDRLARAFTHTPGQGRPRSATQQELAYERTIRQRWRALALVIKAKLEAVEAGISIFEDEFMANIVLPDGKTVSDFMRPQIESAYVTGKMPPLLPYYGDRDG
jgi:hypothetical protein